MEDISASFWILFYLKATALVFSQPTNNFEIANLTTCSASGSVMELQDNIEMNSNMDKLTPGNACDSNCRKDNVNITYVTLQG